MPPSALGRPVALDVEQHEGNADGITLAAIW